MFAFALLTAVATLAYGEHYLIDLAAACPFSVVIWFLCMGERPFSPTRTLTVIGGVVGYLGWICAVRFAPQVFYTAPFVPWGALLLSLSYILLVTGIPPSTESPASADASAMPSRQR
jgi:hypothetical protein